MSVLPADVRGLSLNGEFNADPPFSDAAIQKRIDRAALVVSAEWGTRRDEGQANAAAHFLVMDQQQSGVGAAGPVTARTVGQVSEQYASPQVDAIDSQFASTSYGRTYLMLRDLVPYTGTTAFSQDDVAEYQP